MNAFFETMAVLIFVCVLTGGFVLLYTRKPKAETAEDIQDALKGLLGRTIKEMMEAEMGIISATKSPCVSTPITLATAINLSASIQVTGTLRLKCRRIAIQPSSRRLCLNVKRIFQRLTEK